MSSFVGVLVGILMIPGSVLLLSWNEYRTIHRTRGLNEAAQVVQSVADVESIDPALNDKLIHMSGRAESRQELSDPLLPVPQRLIHLRRNVEMYQWVEDVDTRTRDKLGGGKETIKEYSYHLEWHADRVNSERFEVRSGHENPALAFDSQTTSSDQVYVGAYPLNSSLIGSINDWRPLSLDTAALERLPDARGGQFSIQGNQLYWTRPAGSAGANGQTAPEQANLEKPEGDSSSAATSIVGEPGQPKLGDLRIGFEAVSPTDVSLVSAWKDGRFEPYVTSNKESVERLYLGKKTAAEVFAGLQAENSILAWLLRFGGFVLCGVGFALILGPLSTIASIIPFFGKLTSWLTGLVAMLLAVVVSTITIALAWIAVRPLLGIGLLLVAGIGIFLLLRLRRNNSGSLPIDNVNLNQSTGVS